jgi:Nif-specific regulatory protein
MATSEDNPRVRQEINELSLLFEISRILESSIDLRDAVGPVLRTISEYTGIVRGVITLLNRKTGEISIESAVGLSPHQQERGRYRLGEGVTGKVVQTGRPAVIPRISHEPLFLDESTLNDDVRLFSIIGSMISQAVKLRQSAQEAREKLLEENIRLQEELKHRYHPAHIIGNSNKMQEVYDLIHQVANSETTVLLRGESGTGKELVAHAIHYASPRAHKPFIKVNCAALPESIIDSELFGHEKGAFTGALYERKGRFELAHGGSLFLDEIGDLSPATQIRLLRVLQEKEFERVGGVKTIKTDVRIITATNLNLEEHMAKGRFREDLYYRLNVFPIHIPPLRARKTDILLLADHFVDKYSKSSGKDIRRISTPAIDMLMAYHWPGNVRELENCIERAVLMSNDDVIHGHHLSPSLQTAEASGTTISKSLDETLEGVEREMLIEALKSSRGNMAKAARLLGISDRRMGLRVHRYGIDPKRFNTNLKGYNYNPT